jgi:adenylosuccinate lyase
MFGQEMVISLERLENLIERYPVRGLKGAVGTQLDQLTLLGGRADKVASLESRVLKHLGIPASLDNVGQVYPRGLDFEVVSALHQVGAAASSFATTMRLMAGAGLLTEGFQEGQVGSSAMPHKANARNCERICGFSTILGGYVTMTGTWPATSGTRATSRARSSAAWRFPTPSSPSTAPLETLLTVLEQLEAFPSAIAQENERNLPFLATTTILMESVKRGSGRETAHEAIKEHSLAAVKAMRNGTSGTELLDRLAGDKRIGLSKKALLAILAESARFVGAAPNQVDLFVAEVKPIAKRVKGAAEYRPTRLL